MSLNLEGVDDPSAMDDSDDNPFSGIETPDGNEQIVRTLARVTL